MSHEYEYGKGSEDGRGCIEPLQEWILQHWEVLAIMDDVKEYPFAYRTWLQALADTLLAKKQLDLRQVIIKIANVTQYRAKSVRREILNRAYKQLNVIVTDRLGMPAMQVPCFFDVLLPGEKDEAMITIRDLQRTKLI